MKRKLLYALSFLAGIFILARLTGALSYYKLPSTSNEPNLKLNSKIIGSNLIKPRPMDFAYFKFSDSLDGWTLIKRLVAVPGDKLECKRGVIYVNDKNIDTLLNLRHSYIVANNDARKIIEKFKNDESFQMYQKGADSIVVFLDSDYVANNQLNLKRYIHNNEFSLLSKDIASKRDNWSITDFGPIVLPPKKYFLLGDNRDNSLDSRYRGFVDEENIMGTLIYNF
ncbi:signal peptidase I [Winogradskyella sp. J14-2]|uniref:signal peptidase I n=1 Tax=Winogradskyella sp. J14-2 TaxID=1936080 RepID=UPI000972CB5B|nr:signal peptidase I [Winogradskyella sp. J14-2]APY09124.1 signal peptidase I [Winogradskyella sp. J14-2]